MPVIFFMLYGKMKTAGKHTGRLLLIAFLL